MQKTFGEAPNSTRSFGDCLFSKLLADQRRELSLQNNSPHQETPSIQISFDINSVCKYSGVVRRS